MIKDQTDEDIKHDTEALLDELRSSRERLQTLKSKWVPHLPTETETEAMGLGMMPSTVAWEAHGNLSVGETAVNEAIDCVEGASRASEEELIVDWLARCRDVDDDKLQSVLWALGMYLCSRSLESSMAEIPSFSPPDDPQALRALVQVLYDRLYELVTKDE